MQQKDSEESTGISATLRFEICEEMRAERKQPTKPGLENVLAELLLKEAHGEWTCCRCLRVCFHLFSSICLRLCLMSTTSLLGLWILCFFYFHISWMLLTGGSVFLPWGLREGRCWCALICTLIGPYGVFFFCLFLLALFFFLFLLFPIFLVRVLAVCFSWSRSLAPFASECIWNEFFLIWNCSYFFSVRNSLFVVSLAWFLSSSVGSGQCFCAQFSHAPCFGFESWLCVVDLAWCWPAS